MQIYKKLVASLMCILLTMVINDVVQAKQMSIDAVLSKTLSKIDQRTNSYEGSFQKMKSNAKSLQGEILKLRTELNDQPKGSVTREETKSKLINTIADFLHQRYDILNKSSAVIGDNLKDLLNIEDALASSKDKKIKVVDPRVRVNTKIADGRAMRKSLSRIGGWAQTDKALSLHFKHLKSLMNTLDRSITSDVRRLNAGQVTDSASLRLRGRHQLSMAIERLSDKHMQIEKSKELLMQQRDQLELTARYARMEMALKLIDEDLPLYADGSKLVSEEVGVPFEVNSVLDDLNKSMTAGEPVFESHVNTKGGHSEKTTISLDLGIPKYNNF